MDQSLSHKLCQLIAGIVVADDDLAPEESAFIDRMLVRFGIKPEDRDIIFPIVDTDEAVERIREFPPDTQSEALDLLVQAAAADGTIVPQEREYLKAVAKAIGTTDRELADLIANHLG